MSVEAANKSEIGQEDSSLANNPAPRKSWVKFDDNESSHSKEPAVISTESVQVNLDKSLSSSISESGNSTGLNPKPLRIVDLPVATVEPIRQGFSNGDVIVTLLPTNTRFPWITPAQFRPELVPEELMAQGLTLTVEEYVHAMELLTNDVRFSLYNICYKRVLFLWLTIAFCVLLGLLFSGLTGLPLFGLGVGWLVLNAAAIFLSMWLKFKLARNLERCLAHVNKQFLRHKILLALDDRGKISCHKVNMCFIYMDSAPCIQHLQTSIELQEREAAGWEERMDISANDIVIQGSRTTRLSRKQERATLLFLRYASRWGKEMVRGYLKSPPAQGNRHCPSVTCPCQYVIKHLNCKPESKLTFKSFFTMPNQDAHSSALERIA
ncbi:transmembrane protein 268 isoform X2 [Agrilus planipennis]|uniref:Transmembrane protein 268 isoform X2 n=1 Tax=Agrilus planipennis TaxID=224129 RepID=A0A1W4XAE3_AGRPL|nr:transmembrane protein 268 isoform X2 [Agrilus planipennis]